MTRHSERRPNHTFQRYNTKGDKPNAATMAAATTNSASEVEETLARIRSHKGVEGVIIMNREGEAGERERAEAPPLVILVS